MNQRAFSLLFCLGLIFVLLPPDCRADGWISGVTAFRQTPEFYFLFAVIVLVESIVVWVWLRPLNALGVLWRVVLLNLASCLAGDALFRLGWTPMSGELWKQAIPFFLVTVALETPLARALFRQRLTTWKATGFVIVGANVASYALLIYIEPPVRNAWLRNLRAKDQQTLALWTNAQMLVDAPGRIYATDSGSGGKHRLKYFEVGDRRWHSVSNSPSVDPRYWHIESDQLAFLTYGDPTSRNSVKLTTLPDCAKIRDFALPPTTYRNDSGWDVALSPDGAKLAVLVPLHEIHELLAGSSYHILGMTCSLVVYDIAAGTLAVCPRKAAHTLCWLPDSSTVLFHSLRDETLHDATTLPKGWTHISSSREIDGAFQNPPVFAYRLDRGVVESFADIRSPHLAVDSNRLVYIRESDALGLLDLGNKTHSQVTVGRMSTFGGFAPSPDARFALVSLVLNPQVSYVGYPTIVDMYEPSRRYHLGSTMYRVVWARTVIRRKGI